MLEESDEVGPAEAADIQPIILKTTTLVSEDLSLVPDEEVAQDPVSSQYPYEQYQEAE